MTDMTAEEAAQVVNAARGEGPVDLRTLVHRIRALAESEKPRDLDEEMMDCYQYGEKP